jgi:ABC-type transporter Mla subunit MlaD
MRVEIQSLRKAAEALEQAGKELLGRMANPDSTASAVNEAGKHLVSAARQLRGAAGELGDILDERRAGS